MYICMCTCWSMQVLMMCTGCFINDLSYHSVIQTSVVGLLYPQCVLSCFLFYFRYEGKQYEVLKKSLKSFKPKNTCDIGQVLIDKKCGQLLTYLPSLSMEASSVDISCILHGSYRS